VFIAEDSFGRGHGTDPCILSEEGEGATRRIREGKEDKEGEGGVLFQVF